MPITQLTTRWGVEELFDQSLVLLSSDENWMVQTQTDSTLILRRDPVFGPMRWAITIAFGVFVVATLGLGLILMPFLGFLFVGRSAQQISINARASGENTQATVNYTSGASKAVRTIIDSTPKPERLSG